MVGKPYECRKAAHFSLGNAAMNNEQFDFENNDICTIHDKTSVYIYSYACKIINNGCLNFFFSAPDNIWI